MHHAVDLQITLNITLYSLLIIMAVINYSAKDQTKKQSFAERKIEVLL